MFLLSHSLTVVQNNKLGFETTEVLLLNNAYPLLYFLGECWTAWVSSNYSYFEQQIKSMNIVVQAKGFASVYIPTDLRYEAELRNILWLFIRLL